jgi:hypothetical protein
MKKKVKKRAKRKTSQSCDVLIVNIKKTIHLGTNGGMRPQTVTH